MEHAPLRPVPARPPGPVDPAEATRHVAVWLPALDEPAATALALVALAGRSRGEVAAELGLEGEQLSETLARARKALRRSLHPLAGSGWCERAERLISDRLDGALEGPGPARLDAHLRNCVRCVEHERRLVQANDALVAGYLEAHPARTAPEGTHTAPEGQDLEVRATAGLKLVPGEAEEKVDTAKPPTRAPAPPEGGAAPGLGGAAAGLGGAAAGLGGLAWTALFALAVVLAVVSVVIAAAGLLGASL